MRTIDDSIDQLLSLHLVTAQLLRPTYLDSHIMKFINETRLDALEAPNRLLDLVLAINHGNAIVSTYGSNFDYFISYTSWQDQFAFTRTLIYDDGCTCELQANCSTQAQFLNISSSLNLPVVGFRIGCTPSESLLTSTLECFYDVQCVDLIQNKTRYFLFDPNVEIEVVQPLPLVNSRFMIHARISDLVRELFVEDWSTNINYSSYFDSCSPSLCTYTYIKRFDMLHVVTQILGLFGGLNLLFKWISPILVRSFISFYQYWKNRSNRIRSSGILTIQLPSNAN